MRRKIGLLLAVYILCGFIVGDSYRHIRNDSYGRGEVLEYRVHYGFVNAGEGTVEVSPTLYKVNGRPCYRVNVFGKTVWPFESVLRIRDTWRSFIDTSALIPQRFYVNIQEGRYRKEETVFFDHESMKVRSEEVNNETKEFPIPKNIQDLVSGYFFLRTVDFNRLRKEDTVKINAFFDDEFFDFKVKYRGKGEVDTKFGKIKCIKLTPVMPPNKLFDGDNSIRVWISDDKNKIPVKIEADMFVGAVELDLKKFKNLRTAPHFY
jgi:hypothetical protein